MCAVMMLNEYVVNKKTKKILRGYGFADFHTFTDALGRSIEHERERAGE
jgi:hypothetical protein